jgi:nucleoid DNA-binding protein
VNKTEVVKEISKKVPGLSRSQVKLVMEALRKVAVQELKRNKEFSLPGVVKIKLDSTPKRPSRLGRNPLNGNQITIPEKPAGKKLKARFFKALKLEVGQVVQAKKPQPE